ncbi:MAG: DUF4160 domain-containing protein [Limnothrix sp. CACIAM 69d]|nr:MAG: DUF4160 domain-containing protein [Limnothrix sp. CACIAM 69d]
MPTIARFQGIIIYINYNDHQPPYFHARYQDQEVLVELDSGLVQGKMNKQALRMVLEWADQHDAELRENWQRARDRKPLLFIES